jgi:hypothetical protein
MPAQPAIGMRSSPTIVASTAMKTGLVPMMIEAVEAFIRLTPLMKTT